MNEIKISVDINVNVSESTQNFISTLLSSGRPSVATAEVVETKSLEAEQEKPVTEDGKQEHKTRTRKSKADKERETKLAELKQKVTSIIQRAELISSEAGEQYHSEIESALDKYNAEFVENLNPENYEAFEKILDQFINELDGPLNKAPESDPKPEAKEEPKPEAKEEPKPAGKITLEDLRVKFKTAATSQENRAKLRDKLSELGSDNLTNLDPSKYEDMNQFIDTL